MMRDGGEEKGMRNSQQARGSESELVRNLHDVAIFSAHNLHPMLAWAIYHSHDMRLYIVLDFGYCNIA